MQTGVGGLGGEQTDRWLLTNVSKKKGSGDRE